MDQTPAEYFTERGFGLAFSTQTEDELLAVYSKAAGWSRKQLKKRLKDGSVGPVFANLQAPNGRVLTAYGTGATEDAAAERAMRRWGAEQGD